MLKITRLTDYATVLLAALAREPELRQTAAGLAARTHIGAPTVSKLMKQLQRTGLVVSARGLRGGYQLARPASSISAAAILDALEGPVALTECSAGGGHCGIQSTCHTGRTWQRVNLSIRRALDEISLAQLAGLDTSQLCLPTFELALHPKSLRGAVAR